MIHSFLVSAAILTTQLSNHPSIGSVASADGIFTGFRPADSSYTLSGTIEGLGSGWIYLRHMEFKSDSVRADHDHFVFTGTVTEPEYCLLETRTPVGHKDFRVQLFLQSGQLRVSGKQDAPEGVVITGGKVQDEYKAYMDKHNSAVDWSSWQAATLKAKENNDKVKAESLEKATAGMLKQERQFVVQYARDHPASYVTVNQLYFNFAYNPDPTVLEELYNGLDGTVRSSYFGRHLREVLDASTKTAVGSQAPAFTQNDVGGKPVNLSDFKGSYLLIDFWASWCGPCRAENPAVVKAFQKYHGKGFAIIGVSLDDKKEKWIEAIRKDRLSWTQVSDLQGWSNSVAELYGVKGIPMNFLLDKDGKIIATGLRGEELDKTLAQLLH